MEVNIRRTLFFRSGFGFFFFSFLFSSGECRLYYFFFGVVVVVILLSFGLLLVVDVFAPYTARAFFFFLSLFFSS